MRASHYAKALFDLTENGKITDAVLVERVVATATANGHAHLLPKIARSFERIVAQEEKRRTIVVTGATALSQEDVIKLLKREPYSRALSADHKKVVRKTDDTLVGGVVVRAGSLRVDGSYKRALLDLYQSLISS